MSKFSILMISVPHDKGENLTQAAVEAGSFGGTVFMGIRATDKNFKAIIGLFDQKEDVIMMLVEKSKKEEIAGAIIRACENEKKNFGQMISIGSGAFMKGGALTEGGVEMENQGKAKNKLITVIVNKGYAEDTMYEARKAGAGGGTIINARGTAREDDEKFFGMHIVPEKEMLMIVVPSEKYEGVMESIRNLKYLSQPGSGIAFVSDVEDFSVLGKK